MNTGVSNASWSDATVASLQNVWARFINVLPLALAALIILILGLVAARLVATIVRRVAHRARLDDLLERTGVPEKIRQGGLRFTLSGFLASLSHWFIVLVTLTVVADTLQWHTLGDFLRNIVSYTPTFLVGIAIVVIGVVASRIVHDVVEGSARASGVHDAAAETIAGVARVSILVFSAMAALTQIGIATDLIKILFAGVVLAAAIGIGLAFGLGGQEQAGRLLKSLADSIRSRGSGRRAA